jgi:hypothetical protein
MEGISDFAEKEIKVELEFKDQPFCPANLPPIKRLNSRLTAV